MLAEGAAAGAELAQGPGRGAIRLAGLFAAEIVLFSKAGDACCWSTQTSRELARRNGLEHVSFVLAVCR